MLKYLVWSLWAVSCLADAGQILPLDEGLTLAEVRSDGLDTIVVLRDHGDRISAINVTEVTGVEGGIADTFHRQGFEGIRRIAETAPPNKVRTYRLDQLLSPAGNGEHHIALGFNYPEHADEIEEEHEPFLFLKMVQPSREAVIATEPGVLLDYEVEICFRPMSDLTDISAASETHFGIFLCGDFTDRAELLRGIDLDNMRSGRGFSAAKSKSGYFPTGPYLVIPKNRQSFINQLSFELWVNGERRQSATAGEAIWSLDRSIEELFTANRYNWPTHSSKSYRWLPNDVLTSDMTILSGTPEGVIMRPPSLGFKLTSGIVYLATGAFLDTDVRSYAIRRYINMLSRKGIFLQPNDQVRMEARHLGGINVVIGDGAGKATTK